MFHATLDSTKTWKQIVDALATLLTEAHLRVTETGMSLRQLDSSKAAMVDLNLPAAVFQEYACKGEHDICLGIDELARVSKRMGGDERLEFNLDESDNRLEIKMIGQAERQFKLQLLAPPDSQTNKPGMSFEVKAEMYADAFKQAIKDVGVVSSHVKISAEKNQLTFTGEGDTGEAKVSLTTEGDDPALFQLKVESGQSVAMYALNYLAEISKAIAGDSVVLQFTGNKPMMLEFAIADAGNISFILAPRVERR
ncbi:MAG: proliferating cell nuclear antigen (pcna) [Candidatus Thorarchaeota archaeon]|nr:proliferating cell nuclear antigen (pcna) [Candidatus Thorarchaeota archaeon]